jgi:hypothetical protein
MDDQSDWPFAEPENLATFTTAEILAGSKPVLEVHHDLSDGLWQFLSGDELETATPKLVCLRDVVGTDRALLELADLPLGAYATRPAAGAPWTRHSQHPTDWDALILEGETYAQQQQLRLEADFQIGSWERFDLSQEQAAITFSTGGIPRVRAKIQIIGSFAHRSSSWLWSWANESILPEAAEAVHLLETFGAHHGLDKLSTPGFPATEPDGWQLASVACLLLEGDGVYRAPGERSSLFVVMRDVERVE